MRLLVLLFLLTSKVVQAQFNIELGGNFNHPVEGISEEFSDGLGIYLAPKYSITENWELNLPFEYLRFRYGPTFDRSSEKTSVFLFMPTVSYCLGQGKFNPFARFGVGFYDFNHGDKNYSGVGPYQVTIEEERVFEMGLTPGAGIYFDRFTIDAAYHIMQRSSFVQFNFGVRVLENSKQIFKKKIDQFETNAY